MILLLIKNGLGTQTRQCRAFLARSTYFYPDAAWHIQQMQPTLFQKRQGAVGEYAILYMQKFIHSQMNFYTHAHSKRRLMIRRYLYPNNRIPLILKTPFYRPNYVEIPHQTMVAKGLFNIKRGLLVTTMNHYRLFLTIIPQDPCIVYLPTFGVFTYIWGYIDGKCYHIYIHHTWILWVFNHHLTTI